MAAPEVNTDPRRLLPAEDLLRLIPLLARRGYLVAGPTVRDGAIVYDFLESPDELPRSEEHKVTVEVGRDFLSQVVIRHC